MDKKTTGLLRTALLATTTAALTACGGGSDGGDSLPTSGSYAISASSGPVLTNELSDTVDATDAIFYLGHELAITFADATAASAVRQGRASALQAWRGRAMAGKRIASATRRVTASGTEIFACGQAGSRRVSVVDQNDNGIFDNGDSVSMTFSACRGGDGLQFDGSLAVNYHRSVSYNASTGAYALDATARFTQLTVTTLSTGEAGLFDGEARIGANYSSWTAGQDTLSAPSFSARLLNNGVVTQSRTLEQLSWNLSTDAAGTTSATLATAVSSEVLGGRSVVITTPTAMRTLAADNYPSVGVVKLTGASNASVTLTALSANLVRRDIDTNGDGVAESSTPLSWASVMGVN